MQPRLIVQQKISAMVNKYRIFTPVPDGGNGNLVALAQQKRLALKEKVLFYTDEKRDKLSFTFRAEKTFDVHGRYFVEDANGKLLGVFKKEFTESLINSTWKILDADGGELFVIRESNQVLAILRRFLGWIPLVGEIAEMVLAFFKYHFDISRSGSGELVGRYRKTTTFRAHYMLETTDALWDTTDWRVLAAIGVALDALQSR